LKAPRTIQLDIGVNNGQGCVWDSSNDWSYSGLPAAPSDGSDPPKSRHITVYSGDYLVFGDEPPGCFAAATPVLCP